MLVITFSAAMAGCAACLLWALAPARHLHPSPHALRAESSHRSRPTEPLLVKRRFFAALDVVGALIPPALRRGSASLADRLSYVGSSLTPREFRTIQVVCAIGGVVVCAAGLMEFQMINPLWLAPAGGASFFLPNQWLRLRRARKSRAIHRLLPEVIDLLSLCVGAGLDLFVALNKVLLIKALRREPLMEELAFVLQDIELGKRRLEALRTMAKRIDLPELSSLIRMVIQADRMGTPIVEVLMVHAEEVRRQRFMRAERAALRAPINILFPLIFCIMPSIALIVGAPIFIQFMHQNPFSR